MIEKLCLHDFTVGNRVGCSTLTGEPKICPIRGFNDDSFGSSARQPGHCPKLRPAAWNLSCADNVKAILHVESEFFLVESFRVAGHPLGVCSRQDRFNQHFTDLPIMPRWFHSESH